MRVLCGGPFIGSFEQEVLTFRPYMKWVYKNGGYDINYISSHFNRKFLYNDIPSKRFMPVYKQLSRYEFNQIGYYHSNVDQKDFVALSRSIREKVSEISGFSKKDIEVVSLPYVKYISPISTYHKIFEPISVPISPNKGNVIFIPGDSISEEHSIYIYNFLCDNYDVSVIGDFSCKLHDQNELLQDVDYLQTGYQKIITAITNATAVITPCSFWTSIANLQGVPVLSWGDTVGPYKEGGVYHFNNYKSRMVYHDSDSKIDSLIKQIDSYLKGV